MVCRIVCKPLAEPAYLGLLRLGLFANLKMEDFQYIPYEWEDFRGVGGPGIDGVCNMVQSIRSGYKSTILMHAQRQICSCISVGNCGNN